jgi:hypothetical protein
LTGDSAEPSPAFGRLSIDIISNQDQHVEINLAALHYFREHGT